MRNPVAPADSREEGSAGEPRSGLPDWRPQRPASSIFPVFKRRSEPGACRFTSKHSPVSAFCPPSRRFPLPPQKAKPITSASGLYRKSEAVSFTARLHRRGGPEDHSVPADSCPASRSNLISDNYFTMSFQQLTQTLARAHAIFVMGAGMFIRHARGCSASRAV